jgi:PAS domain-containing protein
LHQLQGDILAFQNAVFDTDAENVSAAESGFFTWDISTDRLYADGAVAELFGLDGMAAERGLPLERYLARIHVEDRAQVAAAIHESITTGEPEQQSYRTLQADGTYAYVMVFGRCFRDHNGMPLLYAGIVCPVSEEPMLTRPLVRYCLTAYEIAVREGNETVAQHLLTALDELEWLKPDSVKPN